MLTSDPIDGSVAPDATLLVVCGGPGTGKTTWAKRLATVWPRPLLVWDMERYVGGQRAGALSPLMSAAADPYSPDLSRGLPAVLPQGTDVVIVIDPIAMNSILRPGVEPLSPNADRLIDWCATFRGHRALALVSTDQVFRQTTNAPSVSGSAQMLQAWEARFQEAPDTLKLSLGRSIQDKPYDAVLGWRHALNAEALRRTLNETLDSGTLSKSPRPRL